MAMVHAATHAYEHKEGWADDAPPTDAYPQEQHLVAADPVKPRDAPEEFYKAPPKQGYFYANNKVSESNILMQSEFERFPLICAKFTLGIAMFI